MRLLAIIGLLAIGNGIWAQQRWTEPIPYGDMDQWQVRYIKESKLLGGQTKTLYAIAPTDTVRENKAYVSADGNPWGCSATYAKFMGIETAMEGSVVPERRGYGYCCRMSNVLSHVNIGDIYAMVSGTIYMGQALSNHSASLPKANHTPLSTLVHLLPPTLRHSCLTTKPK